MEEAAPRNGLKVIAGILALFLLVAGYGQWQRSTRASSVQTKITALPNESPKPAPNDRR